MGSNLGSGLQNSLHRCSSCSISGNSGLFQAVPQCGRAVTRAWRRRTDRFQTVGNHHDCQRYEESYEGPNKNEIWVIQHAGGVVDEHLVFILSPITGIGTDTPTGTKKKVGHCYSIWKH